MKRYNRYSLIKSFLFLGLLIISSLGHAQSTVVSGTVTDNLGQVWSNGSITAVFYGTPGYPPPFNWSGGSYNPYPPTVTLSPTGTFSISLPSNNAIAPGGSQWTFTVCPNATFTCASVNIPLTTSTLNISSNLTAAIGSTIIQPIVQPTPVNSAYGNSEVKTPPAWGHLYFDSTLKALKVWNGIAWVQLATGGLTPTIQTTTSVLKGDNAGNAVAAVDGTDFLSPLTGVKSTSAIAQNIIQTGGTSLGVNTLNNVLYAAQWCTTPGTLDQTCLSNAVTAIGASSATISINSVIPITATFTVPANITLSLVGSGGFNIAASQSLIIGGPFEAPLQKVFFGSGSPYFYGSNVSVLVLPQWFGATGNGKAMGYNATAGNPIITLRPLSVNNFVTGDVVTMVGAGAGGSNLTATLNVSGGIINTSPTAITSVSDMPIYNEDDSSALNAWTNSTRGNTVLGAFYDNRSGLGPAKLYMPKGVYQVCTTPVLIYSSTVLEAEEGSTNVGGSFSQCNPSISVLKISANNFDPQGVPHNWGNGNSYFKHVQIRGTYNAGSITRFPTIQYLNAANLHSDNRWDHPMFESVNGPGFGLGFSTTGVGTITAGSTTMTITDASTFCNATFAGSISQPCNQIIIVGAGTAGANLPVTITMTTGGGGGTLPGVPLPGFPNGASYSVTFSPATVTTVTNPIIYPAKDTIGALTIEHAEMDGGQYFLLAQANASGNFTVDNSEIFNANNGAFISSSLQPISMNLDEILCDGCGVVTASGAVGTAITWVDQSNAKTSNVNIRNSQFLPLMIGGVELGGIINITGANSVAVSNNRFYNTDIVGGTKSMFLQNITDIHISDNQFYWDTTFNGDWSTAHLIEINDTNSLVPTTSITNNTFVNNSTTTINLGVAPDIALTGAVITGNNFRGTGAYGVLYNTNITGQNIRNTFTTQNFVQRQAAGFPTAGTWQTGDIVWNNFTSTTTVAGWICTAGGSAGTWVGITLP